MEDSLIDKYHENRMSYLKDLQRQIHNTAVDKGWWEDHTNLREVVSDSVMKEHPCALELPYDLVDQLYIFARSMLMVTEISEGIEALRIRSKDDKLPEFDGLSVELADAIIRILDLAEQFKLPVIEAMLAKVEYNKGRSYKHGGKSI